MKTCIHSSVVSALLSLGFSISPVSGGWTETVIGGSDNGFSGAYGEVLIAAARNDGNNRIYVNRSLYSDGVYELSWSPESWVQGSFGSGISKGLAIGSARPDGIKRVYSGGIEYTYTVPNWSYSKTFGSDGNDIELQAGRNDGVNRLYVGGDDGFMAEYTWVPATTSYSDSAMPSAPSNLNRLAFADGRNDGVKRLYGVTAAGELCEWSYSGGWTLISTNFGIGQMYDIAIGNVRGDGLNRVYLACADGLAYEASWNGATWALVSIGFGTQEMTAVTLGVTRNDGVNRVLVGNQDGRIYELRFQNGNWIQDLVMQSSAAVQSLAVGGGRGDGVNRIYASSRTVKEYTYTPTNSDPFAAQILPNGILEWSSVPGGVYDVEWSSDLTTWKSDWSSLTGIQATGTSVQKPIPRFFRVKRRTE